MKKIIFIVFLFANLIFSFGQNIPQKYYDLIKKADSLYNAKEYKSSAFTYSSAFKENGWKGRSEDRYNVARSWALANYPDSAFFQLNRIATKGNYSEYTKVLEDNDFNSLHKDKRWISLLDILKQNKERKDRPLVRTLDSIYVEDQHYRLQIGEISKKNGNNSRELDSLWKIIMTKDISNSNMVTKILDQYGWLGSDIIGNQGNYTLFLVIQHSNLETQKKYLPMMLEAVKKGNALASNVALLEDRIAISQGKKQIYGSQVGGVPGNYYILPIEDPDNVDLLRSKVGLQPLAEYLNEWNIKWDVEKYKKEILLRETK